MSIYTTHGTQDPLRAGDSLASAGEFHVDATERERSRVRVNPQRNLRARRRSNRQRHRLSSAVKPVRELPNHWISAFAHRADYDAPPLS